jgi:hypothetical protein
MRYLVAFLPVFLIFSCIPIKIAPKIKDDKVVKAKKFKRKLSKDYAFIFKDTKESEEFYSFINTKYDLDNESVNANVPFILDKKLYFFSFNEIEKETKTLNFLPFLIDAALQNNDMEPMLEDTYTSRFGHWYIVMQVYDVDNNDCLNPNYPQRKQVIEYLRNMRKEYFATVNYNETRLKDIE